MGVSCSSSASSTARSLHFNLTVGNTGRSDWSSAASIAGGSWKPGFHRPKGLTWLLVWMFEAFFPARHTSPPSVQVGETALQSLPGALPVHRHFFVKCLCDGSGCLFFSGADPELRWHHIPAWSCWLSSVNGGPHPPLWFWRPLYVVCVFYSSSCSSFFFPPIL